MGNLFVGGWMEGGGRKRKRSKTDATEAAATACGEFLKGQRMDGEEGRESRIFASLLDGVTRLGFVCLPALLPGARLRVRDFFNTMAADDSPFFAVCTGRVARRT